MFSLYNNKRHFYTAKYTTNPLKISFLEVSVKKVLSLYLTFLSGLYVVDKVGLKCKYETCLCSCSTVARCLFLNVELGYVDSGHKFSSFSP